MENYEYTRPQADRQARASIKRLKRKNRRKSVWIGILIFVILLLLGVIGFSYARYYREKYKTSSYEYISMTEEASARALVWLSQIEDTDLSYEDVKNCMGDFNLEVVKKPTDVKGEYTYELADGAYEYCLNQSRAGFEKAYYEALKNRIKNTGYEEDITDELVDRLMSETFGMSVSQYLDEYDVKLMPDQSEINDKYIEKLKVNVEK